MPPHHTIQHSRGVYAQQVSIRCLEIKVKVNRGTVLLDRTRLPVSVRIGRHDANFWECIVPCWTCRCTNNLSKIPNLPPSSLRHLILPPILLVDHLTPHPYNYIIIGDPDNHHILPTDYYHPHISRATSRCEPQAFLLLYP